MFLEYPSSPLTGIEKAALSVRAVACLYLDVADDRLHYAITLRTQSGIACSTRSIPLDGRTDYAESLAVALVHGLGTHPGLVDGRHVDLTSEDRTFVHRFQRLARGGRIGPGAPRADVDMDALQAFCEAHRIALTVRLDPELDDVETGILELVAERMSIRQFQRREDFDFMDQGPDWRPAFAAALEADMTSKGREMSDRASTVSRRFGPRAVSASLLPPVHGQSDRVCVPRMIGHVLDELRDTVPRGVALLFVATASGGTCCLSWRRQGWRILAAPGDAPWVEEAIRSELDLDPQIVVREIDDATRIQADAGIGRGWHPCTTRQVALLRIAHVVAGAAGRTGQTIARSGELADMIPFVEGLAGARANLVIVASDFSASKANLDKAIGYVVVGDETATFGCLQVDFRGTQNEPMASIFALGRALVLQPEATRFLIASDDMTWVKYLSARLANPSDHMDDADPADRMTQLARIHGVTLDVVWQKGHTDGIDDLSVANVVADRLASFGRRSPPLQRTVPSRGWRADAARAVASLERMAEIDRSPGPVDPIRLAAMAGVDPSEIDRLVLAGELETRNGGIVWESALSLAPSASSALRPPVPA